MSFTLGVENAPSPATQWMAECNATTTGVPIMTGPLPLAQRWNCTEAAPGVNWLDIACFDVAGSIVQESMVSVTMEDGKDYTFDFATQTLLTGVPGVGITDMISAMLPLFMLMMFMAIMMPMMKGMTAAFAAK